MARKGLAFALALLPFALVMELRAQEIPATRWYPLKEGTAWHYRVVPATKNNNPVKKGDEDPSTKVVLRVIGQEVVEIPGKGGKSEKILAVRLEGTSGPAALVEHILVTNEGIYRIMGDKVKLPPLRILKLPPAQGDAWEVDTPGTGKGKFTVREAQITVPDRKEPYRTYHVKGDDFMVGVHKMSAEYWFAEDVGIVKQKIQWGTFSQTLELEKFEPAR